MDMIVPSSPSVDAARDLQYCPSEAHHSSTPQAAPRSAKFPPRPKPRSGDEQSSSNHKYSLAMGEQRGNKNQFTERSGQFEAESRPEKDLLISIEWKLICFGLTQRGSFMGLFAFLRGLSGIRYLMLNCVKLCDEAVGKGS
jgi:hypothetical protein